MHLWAETATSEGLGANEASRQNKGRADEDCSPAAAQGKAVEDRERRKSLLILVTTMGHKGEHAMTRGRRSRRRPSSRRRPQLLTTLVISTLLVLQAFLGIKVEAASTLQSPSQVYKAAYQATNAKDRVRTDKLPTRRDAGHFTDATLFKNGKSEAKLENTFRFLPFVGPSRGKTPVEIEVKGVFPTGVQKAFCHFGGKTTAVKVAQAKRHASRVQTIKFTCYSPPGKAGRSIPVSVSINDVTYHDAATARRFYYYSEPKILEISPAAGDLQGGQLITVYTSHDVFSEALGAKSDDFFQNQLGRAALSNIKCSFDGIEAAGLRKRRCYERSCFVCISPAVQDVGKVEVTVSPNGINRLEETTEFTYSDLNYAGGSYITGVAVSPKRYAFQNKFMYGIVEDPGVFYELEYPGSKYVPGTFYDANMYEFYETSLDRHEAQFCLSKITTNLGPVSGGTVISLGGRGSITKGKEAFYCVFGNTFVQATSVTYSFTEEMYVLQCAAPADAAGAVSVRVSLDGVEASNSGLTYTYHEALDASGVSPSTAPSEGGTSIEISLKNQITGIASRACVCRFQVSLSQIIDTSASFDDTTQKVTCTAPGITTDLEDTAVEVSVSFNGIDFGNPTILFTSGKTTAGHKGKFDFYGLLDGLIPIAAADLVQPITPSLSLSETSLYGEDMCLHFTMNSIAILSGLELFGITQMPDLKDEVKAATFEPSFQMDTYDYTAVVNYEVHSVACRGVGADTYSNIFVENAVVPSLGVSDSVPLVVGTNKIEIAIYSSNGLYSNTYSLQIERMAQRTTKTLTAITVKDVDGMAYTLDPVFSSGTLTYALVESVPYHSSYLAVGVTHADTYGIVKASVAADKSDEQILGDAVHLHTGNMDLAVGSNTLSLLTQAQNRAVSQTYTISATRLSASTDTTFEKIEIKTGRGTDITMSPAFSQLTTEYSANVRYTDTFTITLTTSNPRATFKGPDGAVSTRTGTYTTSLAVGTTALEFVLTAQDLTATRKYVINLTRQAASNDARLLNIETKSCSSTTQGLVEPTFSKDLDTYTAKVFFECTPSGESDAMGAQYISLKPTCFDELCSGIRIYEPKGNRWITATAGQYTTVELNGNPLSDVTNAVLVEVTAEDDVVSISTKKTYTVNAIRQKKDNNANLLSLTVNNAVTAGFPTSGVLHRNTGDDVIPAFDKTHHEYWMEVENSVSSVTITASVASGFAILKVGILSPASLSTVTNGTESQALALTAGQTTTLTVEVLSQRYQPNESVEGYDASTTTAGTNGSGSRIINYIHVFRRTKSSDATLSGLVLNVDGASTGVVTAFNPAFATATTSYTMAVRYYIGTLNITGTCPDTASPVSYKHHTPRCSIAVDTNTGSSGGIIQKTLASGSNTVNVIVTAEDGTTTKTYTVTVTRQIPQTDSSLKSLGITCTPQPSKVPPSYQTDANSSISACWLSKTASGGDPSVTGYDSAFDPTHLTYYVRAQHNYMYHDAAVSPDFTKIAFTAVVNSTMDSIPVATVTLDGTKLTDGVASTPSALNDAPASTFPLTSTTSFALKVTAENGAITTYTVNVIKAATEPGPSEWVKYYELNTYNNKTSDLVAGVDVPFNLEINKSKWNSAIGASLSSLNNVFTPVSAMEFQPVVTLNGSVAITASNVSLPIGGMCSAGYSCVDHFCAANGTTTTTACDKSLPVVFNPQKVGAYELKVQAYSQVVNLQGSQSTVSTFNVIHAAMSLQNTKIVYPTNGLVGYVGSPGTEKVLLQAYDVFGNFILDKRLTYSPDQIEVLLCPPDTISQNSSSTPSAPAPAPAPGYEGYCRCGHGTGCSVPQKATITQNDNGTYTAEMYTLISGVNKIYMSADFKGLPLNGGPGSDYFATYPVSLSVSTNPIGTRSTLVFNQTMKFYVGNHTSQDLIPTFDIAAYDQYGNKIESGGDKGVISLAFEPKLTGGFNLTDEGSGTYKVVAATDVAAAYKVSLYINSALSVGSPFTFKIYAGNFSVKSFADYPAQAYAGIKEQFIVHPRDKFGNAIEYDSPHGSVADRLKLEVTNLETKIKTVNEQTFTLQSDGTYLCNFTTPTNALHNYVLDVSILDELKVQPVFVVGEKVSNVLDILGSFPNPAKSLYFAPGDQKAGAVVLGVVGVDDYGNRSPHFWSRWSASLDLVGSAAGDPGPILAKATSAIYNVSEGGSIQIPFGTAVNISGEYFVKYYYDGNLVDGLGANFTAKVLPADIGVYSKLSKIPTSTSLGQLVNVDIESYDSFQNKILSGGQAGLMTIKIYKQLDPTDVVSYEVVDNGDGTYQARFSPKRSGVYVFEVKYASDGQAVSQTFDVKFEFALPEHFEAIIPPKVDAGVESTVVIQPVQGVDLAAAAKSVISAQLRGGILSNPTNLTVSIPDSEGRRTLKILETKSGEYFLDVLLEGKHVGSSPYNVSILPGPISTTKVRSMNQTTFYSDETISIDLELYDQYNNSAQVDIANDISVKFYQKPEGLIVEADVTGTSEGYIASTKLTLAASYRIQIMVRGVQLCIDGVQSCLPSVTILPGEVNALTSLLEGNGLGKSIVAGVEGNVRVVPLDTYSNLAQESKSQLMEYNLMIFAVSNSSQIGSPIKLAFNSLDASHAASYVLTEAGKYQMRVVQQDDAIVSGKIIDVEVVPSEVVVSNTIIDVITPTVPAGSAGTMLVTLKDKFDNTITTDLGNDIQVVLTNPSKVLSSPESGVTLKFTTDTYNATYSTSVAGEYSISVQIFGISTASNKTVNFVPEVPFALTTIARLAGNGLGVAGQKNILYINGKDKYGNQRVNPGGNYTVDVSVPHGTTTKKLFANEISMVWNAEGTSPFYQVEFVCEPKGIAYIEVKLDGIMVVGSPLSINVSPAPIDPQKCILSGPGTTGGILNQATFFEIQSMDSYGNERTIGGDKFDVSVKCTNSPCTPTSVDVIDLGTGKYDVRYTLASLGTFTLQVRLGLEDVGLLPVRSPLVVSSKNNAGEINLFVSQVFGLSSAVQAGVQQTIKVIGLDSEGFQLTSGGENFVASIVPVGLAQSQIEFQSVDLLNGTYTIQYELSSAGAYQLQLFHVSSQSKRTLVGMKSVSYPISIECTPGVTRADKSYLLAPGIPASVPAGSFQSVYVQSVDVYGNKQIHVDGVEDSWIVTGSPVNESLSLQVASTRKKALADGLYEVSFKLPDIGKFSISIMLKTQTGNFPLGGIPAVILEGTPGGLAPSKVYTLDTDKLETVAGSASLLTFKPRDISGNIIPSLSKIPNCTIALEPVTAGQTLNCLYNALTNTFEASYMSTKSGSKVLSILLDGSAILGSPFTNVVIKPGAPSSATVTGMDFAGVRVNDKLSNSIALFDKYSNAISHGETEIIVDVKMTSSPHTSYSAFIENYGNGTYGALVQVQVAAQYRYAVLHDTNKVLLNQSLEVDPLPTSALQSFVSPNAFFDGKTFKVSGGEVVESRIVAIAEDGNQQQGGKDVFNIGITPDSAYLAQVLDTSALCTSSDGEYSFRFLAKRVLADGYSLSVTLNGKPVKGSPFIVTVNPGEPSASQSNIYSGNYGYDASLGEFGSVAGKGRKFLLQLRDTYGNDLDQVAAASSGNKLSIKIDGASNVTSSVVGLPDGRFEMFYSVNMAGSYNLQAQLSNENVGGGSNIVVVAGENDFSKFYVYGPGISENITVGYTYHFNIEPRDKFGNTRKDDGSTLGLISVAMLSKTKDAETGTTKNQAFELVQVKYEPTASLGGSSEKWLAGSFRVMFKTVVAGEIQATISACPVLGMSCSHVESDLDKYNVLAEPIGFSPYSQSSAKSRGMTASTLSGVGLQGGVLPSGVAKPEVMLPIGIEPRDIYGNVVDLGKDAFSKFEILLSPNVGIVASEIVASDDNQGFSFTLTATSIADYFLDIKYEGSSLTANPVKIPVFSSYPDIDPAQCIDYGEIFEFCVVGQTCKSHVQLFTEAVDSSCWTDQATGKLMVLPSQRYAEMSKRPECKGVFYPQSKSNGNESYVTVLADSNKVNDISDDNKGTYSASMGFSISGLHTVESRVGPDPDSKWIQTITVPIGNGLTKVIKIFSSNTTDLAVDSYPSVALTGQNVILVIQPKDKFGNKQDYVAAIEDRIELNYTSDTYLEYSSTLSKKRSTTSSIPFFYHEAAYVPQTPGIFSGQVYHGYKGVAKVTPMKLPFTLTVLPGVPDNATSIVSGLGVQSSVVYQPANIMVELRDQYGNRFGSGEQQKALFPNLFASTSILEISLNNQDGITLKEAPSITWQTLKLYDEEKEALSSTYVGNTTGLVYLEVKIMGKTVVLTNYMGTMINAGSISASQTTTEGPGVGQTGALSAGSIANFKILAKDSYGNRLLSGGSIFKVVIQSVVLSTNGVDYIPDGKATTSPKVVDNADGTYQVEYSLELASYYHVEVTRGAQGIKGSPFLVQVLPGATDAASSVVYCETDQTNCPLQSISVGKQGKFYIQAKDKFGGDKTDFADQFFYSVVGGGISKSTFAQFRDITMAGQYTGTFFTNTAGVVEITVRLMGNLVYQASTIVEPGPANAFNSEVVSPLFPSSTVHTSSQTVAPKVFVVTRDSFGNKLTSGGLVQDITLHFQMKNSDVTIPAALVDEGDGTYSGSMTIKKAGQYVVKAKLKGESLEKKDLELKPGKLVPAHTLIYSQDGAGAFTAGKECVIVIQTIDEWFNVRYDGTDLDDQVAMVEISVASSEGMVKYSGNSISKTFSQSDGQYRLTFVPEMAGILRLKLTLDDVEVLDQTTKRAWEQQVQSGDPDSSTSIAYGAGVQKALSGVSTTFNVKLADKFGNLVTKQYLNNMTLEFSLSGAGPPLTDISSISKEIKYLGNGLYQAVYVPPVHGANYNLETKVAVSQIEISTPLVTVYKEAGDISYASTLMTKENGEDLVSFSTSTTSAGVPFSVYFQLVDSNGVFVLSSPTQDWLEVSVVPPVKSASVLEVSPGLFKADILAEETGDYKVSFVGGGFALGKSSGISEPLYYLSIQPGWPSSAAQSQHSFYDSNFVAGIPIAFVISAYDAFGNQQSSQSSLYGSENFGATLYPLNESLATDAACKATDNYDGTYAISCLTSVSGSYRLTIYLDVNGKRLLVKGINEVDVEILPGQFSPSASLIVPDNSTIRAGYKFSAIIQGRDSFSNDHASGGVAFDVALTTSDLSVANMYDQKLVDRGDGKYHLTFFLYEIGKYFLSISEQITGLKVGSTESVDVLTSDVDLTATVLTGSGLNGAIAGQSSGQIIMLLKDAYGNLANGQNEVQNLEFGIKYPLTITDDAKAMDYTKISLPEKGSKIFLEYRIQYPGTYSLSLTYKGTEISSVGAVKISPQMSPEFVSATFDSSYRKVTLLFDKTTDRGISTGQQGSDCAKYFKSESLSVFGDRPSCIWKQDDQLVVTLGFGGTLSPGNKLVLRDSVIMNAAKNSLYVSGYVAVKASPTPPPSPTLSIVSSETVGLCDDIVLDVSGSSDQSGRPLTFTYTCESLHADAFKVVEALAAFENTNQTRVVLEETLFVPGLDYKFGVEAKNFLGVSTSDSVTVSKQSIPVPNIYVQGGSSKKISTSQSLTIEAYASFPDGSCLSGLRKNSFGAMQENLIFGWSQTAGPEFTLSSVASQAERNAHASSLKTRYLYIPANLLPSGSYKFQIIGNVKDSSQFASTAEVDIEVEASAISVNFVGGSRSVTINQDLSVAVNAVDPDLYDSMFEYSWQLEDLRDCQNTACTSTSLPVEYYKSTDKLPFSPKVGTYLPPGDYRFTATVTKEPIQANRVVSKAIEITVVNTTAVAPLLSVVGPATAGKFNPSQQLTLEAIVEPSSYIPNLKWSCEVGGLEIRASGSNFLVIEEDTLLGGQDYTFAASIKSDDWQIKAKYVVNVNEAPSSGLLKVSPLTGFEGQTLFEASALNWVDSVGDGPLQYLFYYKEVQSGSPWRLLNLAQDSGTLNFLLPPGSYKIRADISDVHGATSQVESGDTVVVKEIGGGTSRRRLLASTANATAASAFVEEVVMKWWNLGDLALSQQAVDIYKTKFVTSANAASAKGCFGGLGVSALSSPHSSVLQIVKEIRGLKPFSEPLFQQQMCTYAEVSRDIQAVSASNAIEIYTSVAELQKSALTSTGFLSGQSISCMSEAVSNLVLVIEAECEAQPPQLRAEVFRLLDMMQQLVGKQLGPNATPISLTTTSFSTTVKNFVLSDGQNSFGLSLGAYSSLDADHSNFTTSFDSMAASASFTTMAFTHFSAATLFPNLKSVDRMISDLRMIQFEYGFESVQDLTTLGIRADKTLNLELQLKNKYPETRLWNGNQWIASENSVGHNAAFDGVWTIGAKPTNASVLNDKSLDIQGNHTILPSSLFTSTYALHFKMLVFGAYVEDIPVPPPPPPPPPPPSPPPPSPPPPPPLVIKEKKKDFEEIDSLETILVIAGGAFVLLCIVAVCCCRRSSRRRRLRILQGNDDDTDIEDEEIPVVERRRSNDEEYGQYGQLQALASSSSPSRSQYSSSHFNPFASNQVNLSMHGREENRTLRDMLLANRS